MKLAEIDQWLRLYELTLDNWYDHLNRTHKKPSTECSVCMIYDHRLDELDKCGPKYFTWPIKVYSWFLYNLHPLRGRRK